jgi:glutathionyl-hydroquinone reductase
MAKHRGSDPSDPINNADEDGRFVRQISKFRHLIEKGGKHPPEKGRYALYIANGCPWAQSLSPYLVRS